MEHGRILEEYEYYTAQAEAIKKNLEMLNNSMFELSIVKESLGQIKKLGKDNEILIPVGGSSFVRARVIDTDGVIIGIGANVAAERSIPKAEEHLQARIEELEEVRRERGEQLKSILGKIEEIVPHLEKMAAESEKEG